jgi:hypothetical protein
MGLIIRSLNASRSRLPTAPNDTHSQLMPIERRQRQSPLLEPIEYRRAGRRRQGSPWSKSISRAGKIAGFVCSAANKFPGGKLSGDRPRPNQARISTSASEETCWMW